MKDGETVGVGALLGMLAEGAAGKAAPINAGPGTAASRSRPRSRSRSREAAKRAGRKRRSEAERRPAGPTMPPSPSARKLMEEKGVAADDVAGTGKRGQVLKGDVLEALDRIAPPPAEAPAAAPRAVGAGATRRARSACA